jgi:ubiquinone/menaquinone biosynthesis C-methylase UbiE
MNQYVFDNAQQQQAAQRFGGLAAQYDGWTIQHLERTGIGEGWHCLEIGGGGGSIADWLAHRVGPSGHILATDIDPSFLDAVRERNQANLEVRKHDIAVDPLPAEAFDLIHERLVLIHVPQREQALRNIVTALKPGGWFVLEEFDAWMVNRTATTADPAAAALYDKMRSAMTAVMQQRGADNTFARTAHERLQSHGLVDIGVEGYLTIWTGNAPGRRVDRANFEQVREGVVAAGLITEQEVDAVLRLLEDPKFVVSAPLMLTAWGRKPSGEGA